MKYSDNDLNTLRKLVSKRMSEKRFQHTLGVEECAKSLAEILIPDIADQVSSAALLHDIAKEIPIDEQIEILNRDHFPLTDEDIATDGIIHSFTAGSVIKNEFPDFATDEILSAIEKHTVGSSDMSIFDKIIFLSDYIEPNRKFQSCVEVREYMLCNIEALSCDVIAEKLNKACLMAIDGSIDALKAQNKAINSRMYETKKSLLKK